MKEAKEQAEKRISRFLKLKATKFVRTEMTRGLPGNLIVDQINNSLVFLSPLHSYLYEMEYVKNFTDRCVNPDSGHLIWYDYIVRPVRQVSRNVDPELFMEILKTTKKQYRRKGHRVYADGKLVYSTSSPSKADTMVQLIKDARSCTSSPRHEEFKGVKRIRVVDSAGHSTWYIKDRSEGLYNPFYTELGEAPVLVGLPLNKKQTAAMIKAAVTSS